MKNKKQQIFNISCYNFFDSFKNKDLIGGFVLGSDILDLRTEKSDLDLVFLYKKKQEFLSSYNCHLKHCSSFLVIGGRMVQWKILTVLEIKNELLETSRDKKDFSLLASLVKIGLKEAKIKKVFHLNSAIEGKILAYKNDISICALYSFLMSEKDVYPNSIEKAFKDNKMSAASSVNPKFWYTAFLGYSLLFGCSYDVELIKELKDFAYGQETVLIKENEHDILNKVKACYEYYEKNFSNGVDNLIESVYNDIIKGN